MPSPFDLSNFMQDTYTGEIDTKWHNVPDGEYMAQFKEFANGAEMDTDSFNGRSVIGMKGVWVIPDEDVKRAMNIDGEVTVQQDFLVELTGPYSAGGRIDWGVNKNMGLKRVLEAFALDNKKSRNLAQFLGQVAWIEIKNEPARPSRSNPSPDPEVLYSRVKRVMPLEAGRAAYAAKKAA